MSARGIVVGYDRSPGARAAVAWALDEAARTGTPVEFLFAYQWPTWSPSTTPLSAAIWPGGDTDHAIKNMLHDVVTAARHTHPGVPTTVSTVSTGAARPLIDRSAQARLIVLGSREHSPVAGLIGSVTAAVTTHAHCPVIVVHDTPAATAPIIAGIDDSPSAATTLAFAADQATARGVPLRVIRVWPPTSGIRADSRPATRTVPARERQPFDDLVASFRDKYPHIDISAEAVIDHPTTALTQAGSSAQLLVVGNHGHGTVRGILLGSISQHLLRHCACAVAVVPDTTQP